MSKNIIRSILGGSVATAALIGVYFVIVSLISGSAFAGSQFGEFWYYFLGLALGFGIQIGIYLYLKQAVRGMAGGGKVVAVTGTTSTASMVACCSHYLVNILPILGVTAFASFVGAYQVQLFWAGIAFNLAGIAYMVRRIMKFKKHMI
jgi:Cu+-exporting ATPase